MIFLGCLIGLIMGMLGGGGAVFISAGIVVVGSGHLDGLEAMQHVRKRVFTGMDLMQNILLAVTYVKHRLYRSASHHAGYLISFCDAVFLTTAIIDDTLASIEEADADIVLHYVEKSTYQKAGIPAKRTYIPVDGKHYTGSTIYYVRKFSKVMAALPRLSKLMAGWSGDMKKGVP